MYAWINDIQPGGVNRIHREERFPGGKGVHVALAVAELGEEVELLAFWGGATGQWIRQRCVELGVKCHGPELKGWSRTCVTLKSDGNFRDTEFLGRGPELSGDDYRKFLIDYQTLLADADVVCMSGSWPQGALPDAYAQMISLAHEAGKFTLLDTTGESLRLALDVRPGGVHLNRTEAAELFDSDDPRHVAGLLATRCEYALLTSGADGLFLSHGSALVHAHCHLDKIYSAVGSGDCLMAGSAVAIARRMDLEGTARLAVACGAANCIRQELGMLYRKDVEALLPRVIVTREST